MSSLFFTVIALCATALLLLLLMSGFIQFPIDPVRHAQYAGTWYEADTHKLLAQLTNFLAGAAQDKANAAPHAVSATNPDAQLLAIITPHAGYMFSGSTAAYGYHAAQQRTIKRVFVLGPSHHVALHGVALPSAERFETPLGNLQVDASAIEQLKSYPLFTVQPQVHRVEHSLEMQLPFIRQSFGDVKIVPLVVGVLRDDSEIRLVAEILKGLVRKDDLVVVSSDFTHYGPRYGYTPFDNDVRANVERLDKEAFHHLSTGDLQGFIDFHNRTEDTICGIFPCAVLCAMLPDGARGELLKYSTSQDSFAEDQDNSVSYLAIAFCGAAWPENPTKKLPAEQTVGLSDGERRSLVHIARRSLETWVRHKRIYDPKNDQEVDLEITTRMTRCYGAFVTLYKKSEVRGQRLVHSDKELRGCIGSIWPVRPLYQTVVENAIAASTRDPRFDPVDEAELEHIEIEISILTPPRRAESYEDIELGTDGIILSKHNRQAVFLPVVATEFGWDLPETLRQLSMKAGLRENDWQEGAKYDLFQSVSVKEKESAASKLSDLSQ